jgi:hypothetical protein
MEPIRPAPPHLPAAKGKEQWYGQYQGMSTASDPFSLARIYAILEGIQG